MTLATQVRARSRWRAGALPLALAAFALGSALAGCGERRDGAGTPARQEVSVILDVPANANHAGLLTAVDAGSFGKAGLAVTASVAREPSGPLPMVASGEADFAISHAPELLIARSRGSDLVAVAAIVQRPLTALMATGDLPVDPRKLEGARIGTGGLAFQDAFLDEILSSAGVDTSKVKVTDVGYGFSRAMVARKVDATLGAYWNIEGVELRQAGSRPRVLPVYREGVPPYNELVLVAREATVRSDGPLVRRFVQALQRGTEAARKDPVSAAAAVRRASPQTGRREARATVERTLPLLFPTDGRRPFGWMSPERWQALADWMVRRDLLRPGTDPLGALTNEFLPGEGVPPPEG